MTPEETLALETFHSLHRQVVMLIRTSLQAAEGGFEAFEGFQLAVQASQASFYIMSVLKSMTPEGRKALAKVLEQGYWQYDG